MPFIDAVISRGVHGPALLRRLRQEAVVPSEHSPGHPVLQLLQLQGRLQGFVHEAALHPGGHHLPGGDPGTAPAASLSSGGRRGLRRTPFSGNRQRALYKTEAFGDGTPAGIATRNVARLSKTSNPDVDFSQQPQQMRQHNPPHTFSIACFCDKL